MYAPQIVGNGGFQEGELSRALRELPQALRLSRQRESVSLAAHRLIASGTPGYYLQHRPGVPTNSPHLNSSHF